MDNPIAVSKNKQQGFTIIELMISTVIFSVVLLMCMAGILQITRLYYRGVTQSNTQEVARAITNDISEAIQFSGSNIFIPEEGNPTGPFIPPEPSGENDIGFFCIGGSRYTFAMDRQLKSSNPTPALSQRSTVLWVDQPDNGCAGTVDPEAIDLSDTDVIEASNGVEVLKENMRLTQFEISQVETISGSTDDSVWNIQVAVAYGDDDLMEVDEEGNRRRCKPSGPGVEFCATSEISTTVRRRVQ